ncbi:MAG: family 78 glycoside hydrolase catalytic domain [Verrucomicrobia bacterium]|nr:family 78 glycoside hydrolase catalytic domain [Verrucomicrobiota bacterium]
MPENESRGIAKDGAMTVSVVMKADRTTDETWRIADEGGARWIFPTRPDDAVNQVVDFLHDFTCDTPAIGGEILISADTDFVVWLNGHLIGHGQYCNYPDRKTYERLPLGDALREGRNTLAVTVFYNGRTSSVYERGDAGLLFELHANGLLAASGTTTRCRPNASYHSGPIAIVSGQLAYTFGYDARGEDAFHGDGYIPRDDWDTISESEATLPADRAVLKPRPVARLVYAGYTPCRIAAAGCFRRDIATIEAEHDATVIAETAAGVVLASHVPGSAEDPCSPRSPSARPALCRDAGELGLALGERGLHGRETKTVSPAWQMQHDLLTEGSALEITGVATGTALDDLPDGLRVSVADLGDNDGVYLLFDMGREEVGYLELEIEAAAGTMLDMGYGEHLDDGRVRSFVGGRSFGARYICREGRQQFTHHFLRWAGRYLQIHVHAAAFTLHRLTLQRRDYPVEVRGRLTTGSPLHDRLLEVGTRTLHLCMHEHYEDTPWREQALYANDARTQALCGYYAFGETAMPAASFRLLGEGLREDGFLMLTAPARPGVTIPSFTFAWMLAVRDHYLYSGDDTLARAFLPQILSMLRAFLAERRDGLLPLRQVKGIWHFYDWSAGMSGYTDDDFAQGLDVDAPLNCFLILALHAAQQMLAWCGEAGGDDLTAAIAELRHGVAERFWDPAEGVFRTHAQAQTLTELTQALAVLAGVGEPEMRERALDRMARKDSGLAGPGLSQSFYTFEALMTDKDRYGAGVLAGIEATWGAMLDAGATTFWETIKGGSDFSNAGSLCHGWSAVPVYVLYHDLLGIRPLEPGFRTFTVEPMTNVADTCTGRVPVPGGEIVVQWETIDGEMKLTVDGPVGMRKVIPESRKGMDKSDL